MYGYKQLAKFGPFTVDVMERQHDRVYLHDHEVKTHGQPTTLCRAIEGLKDLDPLTWARRKIGQRLAGIEGHIGKLQKQIDTLRAEEERWLALGRELDKAKK